MRADDPPAEGVEKMIDELQHQIRMLEKSTAELQALLASGVDEDGAELADGDRTIYAEAVAENARALATKQSHLDDLHRMRGGVSL